ncbi:hypothetical protein Tsubulata_030954, partial [Turnera subulata]
AVHKVFGASNVSKLLLHLPVHNRSEAAITISYEALARIRDPVYGCIAHIFALQQQVASLQEEIEILGNQIANLTFGIPSHGSSQISPNPISDIQFSSEEYAINPQGYQSEPAAILENQPGYTGGSQAFDHCLTDEQIPPPLGWEDQSPNFLPHPNTIERLLEGVNKDIFTYCSWVDNGYGFN